LCWFYLLLKLTEDYISEIKKSIFLVIFAQSGLIRLGIRLIYNFNNKS